MGPIRMAADKRVGVREGLGAGSMVEEDPYRRLWYLACIDSYRALAPQFPVVRGIVQGLLSMGIRDGMLSTAEGKALMDRVKTETEHKSRFHRRYPERQPLERYLVPGIGAALDPEPRKYKNAFVVDLNTAAVNTQAASLQVLVQSFDEMTMFEEFTTMQDTT